MAATGFGHQSFEPHFQWIREEHCQTLLVHLPGFKKEHLKVQLDSHGNLKISGQRPLAGNRWSRFWKDFRVPENSSSDEIRAKFEDGLLYVIIPKVITLDIPGASPVDGRREPKADAARPAEPSKEAHRDDKSGKGATSPATPTPKPTLTPMPDRLDASMTRGGAPKIIPEEEEEEEESEEESAKKVGGRLRWGGAADRRRQVLLLNVAVALLVLVGLLVYVSLSFRRSQPSDY